MKEKSLKIIISLMTISVAGLIAIQFYWINKAIKLEEEKFNKNVGLALSEVVNLVEKKETAKILISEISNKNSNNFVVMNGLNYFDEKNVNEDGNKVKQFIDKKVDTGDVNINFLINDGSADDHVKVIKNMTMNGDTAVEETIVWHSGVDSLIVHKTKIIENVFEELILNEQEDDLIERINKDIIDSLLSEKLNKYGIIRTLKIPCLHLQYTKPDYFLTMFLEDQIFYLLTLKIKICFFSALFGGY